METEENALDDIIQQYCTSRSSLSAVWVSLRENFTINLCENIKYVTFKPITITTDHSAYQPTVKIRTIINSN